MSRLIIEVTAQQHQHIKALAALQGKSIREYTLDRLFERNSDEEKAIQELKKLLVPRIEEGLAGIVSKKNFDEIVEDEFRSGGSA